MITIKHRIDEIKKHLDELEEHVNSTLSILDCQSYPLNTYSHIAWKDFKWLKWDSYIGNVSLFTNEEAETQLNTLKERMTEIYEQNKILMEKIRQPMKRYVPFL
jgi:hypothetical protein